VAGGEKGAIASTPVARAIPFSRLNFSLSENVFSKVQNSRLKIVVLEAKKNKISRTRIFYSVGNLQPCVRKNLTF